MLDPGGEGRRAALPTPSSGRLRDLYAVRWTEKSGSTTSSSLLGLGSHGHFLINTAPSRMGHIDDGRG
jgi:hypothetical protein